MLGVAGTGVRVGAKERVGLGEGKGAPANGSRKTSIVATSPNVIPIVSVIPQPRFPLRGCDCSPSLGGAVAI